MIRVLHYGLSSNLGGIETYLWNLSRTVDSGKYHFDFVYSDTGRRPARAAEHEAEGSTFHGVTPRRVSLRRNKQEMTELITPARFDILHFHANTASYVEPVRAALEAGVKVIFHSHNAGTSGSSVTQILHRVNSRTIPWRSITRVAVSEEAGHWMFGRGSAFEVIPNGIDVETFRFDRQAREQTRLSLGLGPEVFVIGQIGAFLPAKNQQFSLAVFAEVLRHRPESALLFVGAGPLEERSRARATELGLVGNVHFLGRQDDVPALTSAMDCLLFPSRYEGFGLVAVEAQAAGLACLVSDAVPESVLVIPTARRLPLDAGHGAWAEAVLGCTRSADRTESADAIRDAGFSVARNTDRIEELYGRVIHP